MQTTVIISILLIFTIMSISTNSVLFIILILILIALFTTVIIANIVNSWFALILFLIYITGLLVLFSYMLAITPNSFTMNTNVPNLLFFIITIVFLLNSVEPFLLPEKSYSFEWHIFHIYSHINIPVYWLIAIILLVALLIVVNLTYKSPTPLRPFL